VWKLSRGQYYTEAGIMKEMRHQQARYAVISPELQRLHVNGGALRTGSSEELKAYMKEYQSVATEWWTIALRRVEARAKMRIYMGKRSVLDGFFSRVYKAARQMVEPHEKVMMAYGAAVKSMQSHGRGEVAVPVDGAYSACVRAFGKGNVVLESEVNTTAVSWTSGRRYERVYKRLDSQGKHYLCHTSSKVSPAVTPGDMDAVLREMARLKLVQNRRRGGTQRQHGLEGDTTDKKARYIECRGLRFCPERRMFFDRDVSSGLAIAGLRCLTLKGLGRPSIFCVARKHVPGQSSDAAAGGLEGDATQRAVQSNEHLGQRQPVPV
jgi:hypothetical protein